MLAEFDRISEHGGGLGAMETGYQRGKIQDESIFYEHKKHDGSLPIVGVMDEPFTGRSALQRLDGATPCLRTYARMNSRICR